jgi:hypothetical protein
MSFFVFLEQLMVIQLIKKYTGMDPSLQKPKGKYVECIVSDSKQGMVLHLEERA